MTKLYGVYLPKLLSILAVTLLVASCSAPTGNTITPTEPAPQATQSPAETAIANDGSEEVVAPGSYIDYETYEKSKADYQNTKVVLFFNADWCSTCKVARDNIKESLAEIPSDLTIVKVDYDDSQELKQKYLVTVQHTFVQIDASGTAVSKWSGSVTVEQIAAKTV